MIPQARSPAQRVAEAYFRICRQWRIARTMGSAPAMRQQLDQLAALHAVPGLSNALEARIAQRIAELNAEYSHYLEPR